MPDRSVNVVVARGHVATAWELRQWEALPERFSVSWLQTAGNTFDPGALRVRPAPIRTVRDLVPVRALGPAVSRVVGDRYLGLDDALRCADVVHAEELSFWFAADVARRGGAWASRLVQTVWETLPLLEAYRTAARAAHPSRGAGAYRALPARRPSARARPCCSRASLRSASRSARRASTSSASARRKPAPRRDEHLLVSPGRLVWEKGHHDVLRALALLHRGRVRPPDGEIVAPKLLIVGTGPEERRLREHAARARPRGRGDAAPVALRRDARRSTRSALGDGARQPAVVDRQLHPFDKPRAFWEEQFGYVLAEAMAARLAIVAAQSGAIAEVVGGGAVLFAPGDWPALARALASGPLAHPPGPACRARPRAARALLAAGGGRSPRRRLRPRAGRRLIAARVEDVEGGELVDGYVALAQRDVDARSGDGVDDLDEHEARRVTVEVEAGEDLRLVALDVERQQVDLGRALLVKQRAQRAGGHRDAVLLLEAEIEGGLDPGAVGRVGAVRARHDRAQPAVADLDLAVVVAAGHQRAVDHARARPLDRRQT